MLRGVCIAAVLACAGGCGQKGALYLPTDPAAAGRATLPDLLLPFGGPSIPTPMTSTLPTAEPPLPTPEGASGGRGTGTATPVDRP